MAQGEKCTSFVSEFPHLFYNYSDQFNSYFDNCWWTPVYYEDEPDEVWYYQPDCKATFPKAYEAHKDLFRVGRGFENFGSLFQSLAPWIYPR